MLSSSISPSGKPAIMVHSSTGKEVGEIADGCLQKHVRFTRHLYRNLDGWTWDKAIIEKAIKLGVKTILIMDDEKHKAYRVSMDEFLQRAEPVDHGYGEQLCLPRAFWEVSDIPKQPKKPRRKK